MKKKIVFVVIALFLAGVMTAPLGTAVYAATDEEGDEEGYYLYQEEEVQGDNEGIAVLPDDDSRDEGNPVVIETEEATEEDAEAEE